MLDNIQPINQKTFKHIVKEAIKVNNNIVIFASSGAGKTEMVIQACEELGYRLVYINLAVLERTDFQGFPVVDPDHKFMDYASPSFLPFSDVDSRNEKIALNKLLELKDLISVSSKSKPSNLQKWIKERLQNLAEHEEFQIIMSAASYIAAGKDDKALLELNALYKKVENSKLVQPMVVLFDEADKASPDTNQTLLEFTQFNSINGRKLNIAACILTANLPDEHAHTNQLSHAITKRCRTYKLQIDFAQWREWAYKNNVHDLIIQFLNSKQDYLNKPADNPTDYALPSPRTWVAASKDMYAFEENKEVQGMSEENKLLMMTTYLAGNVGVLAANTFMAWYNVYRKFDKEINALVEKGVKPNLDKYAATEHIVFALSACSKCYSELKSGNKARITKVFTNVFSWLGEKASKEVKDGCDSKNNADIACAAIRLSFQGDYQSTFNEEYGLANIPEFINTIKMIKKEFETAGLGNCFSK